MIIIDNAEEFEFSDFKQSINDIFAAGDSNDIFAVLTLISSYPDPKFLESINTGPWFEFSPPNEVKETKFVNCIWERLGSKKKKLTYNIEILEKILLESNGSPYILRKKWNNIYHI